MNKFSKILSCYSRDSSRYSPEPRGYHDSLPLPPLGSTPNIGLHKLTPSSYLSFELLLQGRGSAVVRQAPQAGTGDATLLPHAVLRRVRRADQLAEVRARRLWRERARVRVAGPEAFKGYLSENSLLNQRLWTSLIINEPELYN